MIELRTQMPAPRIVADVACVCGEGPLWHPIERCVYWTDIDSAKLYRYDPASGDHELVLDGETVGGFTIQADGSLLLFMDRGRIAVWRDGTLTNVVDEIPDERESRFNDVVADPVGRVFCGTMPSPERLGRLYRLDCDGTLTVVLEDVRCSNGMGFTLDRQRMYFTDSEMYEISLFEYDRATGNLSNRRAFHRNAPAAGLPDGMTVDAEGCIWSARWDGSRLVRLLPTGALMQTVAFPVLKVSSVTFGGDDLTDMYITTAGGEDRALNGAHAGSLFHLNLGIRGLPEFASRIGL